jgi:hypothetical protein
MPYYEVIYENGEVAVLSGDSDKQVLSGLEEHHKRALEGQPAGPAGGAASRVKRVLAYEDHPGDYRASGQVDAKDVKKEVDSLVAALTDPAGQVNVLALAEYVKTLVHPMNAIEHAHDSRFKAAEDHEVELTFL